MKRDVEDVIRDMENVYGRHVIIDLYNCRIPRLEEMINIVKKAIVKSNMTEIETWSVQLGDGYSILSLVVESHISIHVWSEQRYIALDVYTCGKGIPEDGVEYILSELQPEYYDGIVVERSLRDGVVIKGRYLSKKYRRGDR